MRSSIKLIPCQNHYRDTNRVSPFLAVVYRVNYTTDENDRMVIDSLIEKAKDMADKVCPTAANLTVQQRSGDRRFANCLEGVVSEYFWYRFLNRNGQIVDYTEFEDAASQIDLKVISNNKTIEVRSSCPRMGIYYAICHPVNEFDILGPYHNENYKSGEPQKDFYVRTLFHLESPLDILEKLTSNQFDICLAGGATWSMMTDRNLFVTKELLPPDAIGQQTVTKYRVIPFSKALDCFQIDALISRRTKK